MNIFLTLTFFGLTTALSSVVIAIEMCMCGPVKWNRARNFAEKLASKFDAVPDQFQYSIVQFAEDYVHEAYASNDNLQTEMSFEDPEAFAGMSSDITSVRH